MKRGFRGDQWARVLAIPAGMSAAVILAFVAAVLRVYVGYCVHLGFFRFTGAVLRQLIH
jgi:uncharacterized membrane protein YphA (DoxX/SURF4 family)